jgi:DNA-binding transcriptional MerR regulator
MTSDEAVSVTPKYLIGRVTKLTGLSIDVVRVWERRYGAVRPARSDGGTRLYSDADIRRLRRLRQAVDGGHSISQAARLSESELDELLADARPQIEAADPYRAVRERFVEAVRAMDVGAADQELARAATLFPARELVTRIVSPLLDELEEHRTHEDFGIAHQHLAAGLLRNTVGSLFRLHPPSPNADTMVLATPAGDRHEFGTLLAALLAATHGWRVVSLGPDVPAAEIALAVRLTNAGVLALSLRTGQPGINEELASVSRLAPASTRIWIVGVDASQLGQLMPRNWLLMRNLQELDEQLGK